MRPSIRAIAAATALGIVGALMGASPSAGQLDGLLPPPESTTSSSTPSSTSSSSSTTTTVPAAVTTTTAPERRSTTTTTQPDREDEPAGSPIVGLPGNPAAPSPDDIHEVDGRAIPAWAVEKMNSVERSGSNSTLAVLEKLEPLRAFGFTPDEIALLGLGQFPVRGEATFTDDWWFPRWTPEFHVHQGTDIFADFGTPITAPFDGVVTVGVGSVGGLYVYLTLEDGSYYYFAHLDGVPEFSGEDRIDDPEVEAAFTTRASDRSGAYRVEAGAVIGFVGNSGNAVGGPAHVHMEIHPAAEDFEPVNPKPILDEWLRAAEEAVDEVLGLYTATGPRAVTDTQRTRAAGEGQFAAPSRPLSAEILGVSSLGPGTGVQVVTEEVVRAVSAIDWDRNREALARPLDEVSSVLAVSLGV